MAVSTPAAGDQLLLSPREPLLAGGAAEAFELQLRQLVRAGHRSLVVDLAGVTAIDSAGIRALVRGHTSAQRAGGTLRLAAARPAVRKALEVSRLAGIFESYDSVDAAKVAALPWRSVAVVLAGTALCGGMLWAGLEWPDTLAGASLPASAGVTDAGGVAAPIFRPIQPFIELAKLVCALLIGLLVSSVHQPSLRERSSGRQMEQAQTLLCVSGAMMMVIVGNSLARAFGIAGAASIIRFRTPVDDPKDVTVLFLLMALGMATGLGSFGVAGLGTAFLCLSLVALDRAARTSAHVMAAEIVATGRDFPTTHVEGVFARHQVTFEPREITQSDDVTIKYHTWLPPGTSLEELSAQLMSAGSGVTAVSWEHPKHG